jgi:hypothetical protein
MIAPEWISPTEWFNALEGIDFVLIVAIAIAFGAFIYGIKRITEMGLVGKKRTWRVLGILFGSLVFLYLLYNLDKIDPGNWAQISLLAGLVGVTVLYAVTTFTQANASAKMAEEMKDTRFATLRPIINIVWVGANKRNGKISASFSNVGPGPALNLKCYLTHKKYKFKFKHDRYTVLDREKSQMIDLPSENFDFKEWEGFAINCDYESVYGESFRSIFKFQNEEERRLKIIQTKNRSNNAKS